MQILNFIRRRGVMNRSQGRRGFVLCADDYALSPSVSRGIVEALAAGRISATSVLTTRPSWPEAAAALPAFAEQADIGLHLNLTLGAPLGAMPQLAPQGMMPGIDRLIRASWRRNLPEDEIRGEIARQLDAFQAALGRPPDFVDGHQHVHVLAGIRGWLLDALAERGLAERLWLRDCADRPWRILARRLQAGKALAVARLARGFADEAAARGFAVNRGFAGFSGFGGTDYGREFGAYLRLPGERHLVMCHPGWVDAELVALDPVTQSREAELRFLLSARFAATLARHNMALVRFALPRP
jgi:chitin disaccharide deacetylase